MAKKVPLAHQQNYQSTSGDGTKDKNSAKIYLKVLRVWVAKWSIASLLFLVGIFFFAEVSVSDLFLYTSYANAIILVLIILSSVIAANTANKEKSVIASNTSVQLPMLYVEVTGTMDDMVDVKRRANSFMLSLAIFIHVIIFYLSSILI